MPIPTLIRIGNNRCRSSYGSYPKFHTCGKIRFFLLFVTALPVYNVYLSHQCQRCNNLNIFDSILKFVKKVKFNFFICLALMGTDPDRPDPDQHALDADCRSGSDKMMQNFYCLACHKKNGSNSKQKKGPWIRKPKSRKRTRSGSNLKQFRTGNTHSRNKTSIKSPCQVRERAASASAPVPPLSHHSPRRPRNRRRRGLSADRRRRPPRCRRHPRPSPLGRVGNKKPTQKNPPKKTHSKLFLFLFFFIFNFS
jgi:hypothetical protein